MNTLETNFQRLLSYTKNLTFLVNRGHHHQALLSFSKMFSCPHLTLDPFVFPLALRSSTALNLPIITTSVHAYSIKSNLVSNPFIASSLVDSYGKCVTIVRARQLFDELPRRNVVVWNAMIALYSRANDVPNALRLFKMMGVKPNASSYNSIIAGLSASGRDVSYQALEFYRHMVSISGLSPNVITILALLPACIYLGALNLIREIHGFAIRSHIYPHLQLGSGLVDAYGRCGCLVYARRIFDSTHVKDVVVWSSMVSAYAFHGDTHIAMSIFKRMELENVRPDGIMFLSILKACSHSASAEDALRYFKTMTERYGLQATSDHYACLVDVLGRAGRLDEAYEVIKGMKAKVTAKAWGALLGACRNYGEVKLAKIAGRALLEMEPENAGNYVLLASVYSRAGDLEEAERVRKEMVRRGVKRYPGSSWIT